MGKETELTDKKKNFFELHDQFELVDLNNDVNLKIEPFLKACQGIVEFVNLMGTAFLPVSKDINGNINKIKKVQFDNPDVKITELHHIIELERGSKDPVGTDALLWLKRTIAFLYHFLEEFVKDFEEEKQQENLTPLFSISYEITLKRHHNFLVRKVFNMFLFMAPVRSSLISLLLQEMDSPSDEKKLFQDIKESQRRLSSNIQYIEMMFIQRLGIAN